MKLQLLIPAGWRRINKGRLRIGDKNANLSKMQWEDIPEDLIFQYPQRRPKEFVMVIRKRHSYSEQIHQRVGVAY